MIERLGGRKFFYGLLLHTVATVLLCISKIDADIWAYFNLTVFGITAGANTITTSFSLKNNKGEMKQNDTEKL